MGPNRYFQNVAANELLVETIVVETGIGVVQNFALNEAAPDAENDRHSFFEPYCGLLCSPS